MWGKIKQWWSTKQVVLQQGPWDGKVLVINKNTKYVYFPYRNHHGMGTKFRHVYFIIDNKGIYFGVERKNDL